MKVDHPLPTSNASCLGRARDGTDGCANNARRRTPSLTVPRCRCRSCRHGLGQSRGMVSEIRKQIRGFLTTQRIAYPLTLAIRPCRDRAVPIRIETREWVHSDCADRLKGL
jgi:hypothetical protein